MRWSLERWRWRMVAGLALVAGAAGWAYLARQVQCRPEVVNHGRETGQRQVDTNDGMMQFQFRKARWAGYDIAAVDLLAATGTTRILVAVHPAGAVHIFRIVLDGDGNGNVAVSGVGRNDIGWFPPPMPLIEEFSSHGVPVGLVFGLLKNGPDIDATIVGNWTLGQEEPEDALDDDLAAQLRGLLGDDEKGN